ncbi:Diamine acetyltransferase 2 [Perkinsus olseni]|uniref:Diamine acetyltransferase 2 n=1 Tax=Perkinsus olseni TaxID=32597 RepID=A0A7J6PG83_PEROL|nr:Diamine acetyltransferase 2 [Perkinsus olseni]
MDKFDLSTRAVTGALAVFATGAMAALLYRSRQTRHPPVRIEEWLDTGEKLVVRAGTAADSHTIHGMVKRLAHFERMPEAVEVTPETLRVDFNEGHYWAAIAEVNGEAVGFALFFPVYSTWEGRSIHLEDLYVLEDSRSKGIGLAMLKYVTKFAAARGCARVEWEALDWNVKAHEFYERIGAAKMPEWIKFRLDRNGINKVASS